jgi:DNA mismatch repair protein MSH4
MDGPALESYLKKLQTEFTIRMNIAADDISQEDHTSDNVNHAGGLPILDRPGEDDLEEWKKKCDAAERRVMHANMTQSQERKRPAPGDETSLNQQKRNKADSDTQSLVSQPLRINRGSMIEELRKGACTPTTRAATPSSFASEISDSDTASVMQENPAQGTLSTETVTPEYQQQAISVSSGSSNYDEDMLDLDSAEDSLPSTAQRLGAEGYADLVQPLEQFQPLKGWYARQGRTDEAQSTESAEASKRNQLCEEPFGDA